MHVGEYAGGAAGDVAEGNASTQFTMPDVAVTCTFTNARLARVVTVQKSWVDGLAGDTVALTISDAGGASNSVSTVGSVPTFVDDAHQATRSVLPGESVTVAELLAASNQGSYGSVLSCEGVTPDGSGQFTMPDEPVACTYTNMRTQHAVQLPRVWVDGWSGDTAALTITGGVTSPASATSTAPDAPAAGNTASTPALSGASV